MISDLCVRVEIAAKKLALTIDVTSDLREHCRHKLWDLQDDLRAQVTKAGFTLPVNVWLADRHWLITVTEEGPITIYTDITDPSYCKYVELVDNA